MPQASEELRSKFPGSDTEALKVIWDNFSVSRSGIIRKRRCTYEPTSREYDAIDYLFHEWDYAYISGVGE